MLYKPTLIGARVLLRPLAISDLPAYMALLQDKESMRLTGTHGQFSQESAARWITSIAERDDRVDLAISVGESDSFVGEVVINDIDSINRSANIRIGLLSSATDKGYGSEALGLMINYAFEQLKLHRLELAVFAFNTRAIHVYEKLGFRQEGRRRDVLFWDGAYHDSIDMSILEHEYRQLQAIKEHDSLPASDDQPPGAI